MPSNSLVSVIIPTYNRAKYVAAAIESVLTQRGGNEVEIIVVDDGSTDETEEILKQFGSKIIYKKIENSGRPAVPRNVGIKIARGELIAFLDSDDLWLPNKLVEQLTIFEDPSVVLCYANAEVIDGYGEKLGKTVVRAECGRSGNVWKELLEENFVPNLTAVARREALFEAGLFNESPTLKEGEDYHLWLKLSRLGKFAFVDEILALYRRHEGNITNISELEAFKKMIFVYKALLKEPLDSKEKKDVHLRLSRMYENTSHLMRGVDKRIFRIKSKYHGFLISR